MNSQSMTKVLRALANNNRLQILEWILDPVAHFPPQQDGDLVEDGVCVGFITEKIGLSQPTVTNHMRQLADAGLVTHRQIKNWVFYKPNEEVLDVVLHDLTDRLRNPRNQDGDQA